MQLQVLTLLLLSLIQGSALSAVTKGSDLTFGQSQHAALSARAPESRDVYVVVQVTRPGMYGFVSSTGKTTFAVHSSLWVNGSPSQPSLKIELRFDKAPLPSSVIYPYCKVEEQKYNSDRETPLVIKGKTLLLKVGTTELLNADFFALNNVGGVARGTGIVLDALKQDPFYRVGERNKSNLNACHHFIEKLLTDHLKFLVPQEARDQWNLWDERTVGNKADTRPPTLIARTQLVQAFVDRPSQLVGEYNHPTLDWCSAAARSAGFCFPVRDSSTPLTDLNELAIEPASANIAPEDMRDTANPLEDDRVGAAMADDNDSRISLVRSGGTESVFRTVSKSALNALGVTGAVIGAAFVIIDFIDHDWIGGAIGAVGLAVGAAAGLTIAGPLGWLVGGLITAFFAILPGAFKNKPEPAEKIDAQGILQWKFFGDKTHTGNEQCQKGTDDAPGNKDCQTLYGAGTLSMVLGMNNFDAIVFLTHFNDGYAMTLKEIAQAFYAADGNKRGDGDDKPAVIVCRNSKGQVAGRAGIVGADDPKLCVNPAFKINRNLITLPNINETADKVINRVVPAPNGDCKLIAYPGDQVFPKYGLKVSGLPSAIACGLTAATNVDGMAISMDGPTATNPTIEYDGSHSTDGQSGSYVAPPPQAPFKPLDPKDYACIVHQQDPPFCLPPGTYRKQSGMGLEIRGIDGMTLPSGEWSFSTHWQKENGDRLHRNPKPLFTAVDNTYRQNQYFDKGSQELTNFVADMKGIDADYLKEGSFTIHAPNDGPNPVCCFFSEPKFGGNVWCVGVGGGDVVPQWKNKAQSVSCHGGANVWIYADSYGDIGGMVIKGNVEDLTGEPYGSGKATFSKNIKAIWVLNPE